MNRNDGGPSVEEIQTTLDERLDALVGAAEAQADIADTLREELPEESTR